MSEQQQGYRLIAGAVLAGAGSITVGLAALANINQFATMLGIVLILLGAGLMLTRGRSTTLADLAKKHAGEEPRSKHVS